MPTFDSDERCRFFLRAAFTCDGGVSFYPVYSGGRTWLNRCVFLSCAHALLRWDYCYLLEFLGISFKDDPKDGKVRVTSREKSVLLAKSSDLKKMCPQLITPGIGVVLQRMPFFLSCWILMGVRLSTLMN